LSILENVLAVPSSFLITLSRSYIYRNFDQKWKNKCYSKTKFVQLPGHPQTTSPYYKKDLDIYFIVKIEQE
jgi:hypothetical protein